MWPSGFSFWGHFDWGHTQTFESSPVFGRRRFYLGAIWPAWLFTQIHQKIILFLFFWDVLWITNDLLAPWCTYFFMNFNKSQFLRTISLSNESDFGRVAYNHEFTQIYIKISSFKSLIYKNYFYIFTENLILKILQKWSAEEKYWWRKGSISMSLMNIDGYKLNPNTREKDMYRIITGV